MYRSKVKAFRANMSIFWLIVFVSCTRPIAVTHWDAKERAMVRKSIASKNKNAYGYPKHTRLSGIICFNENCINRQESINRRNKYRFKGFKNNDPIHKEPKEGEENQNVIAGRPKKKEKPAPVAINQVQTFQHVYFETGKAKLNEEAKDELNELVHLLNENPALSITVSGHTDNVGDPGANMRLSQARADAVIEYIATQGISKNRLIAKGYGSAKPVTTNDTPEGRDQNRRVEFIISDSKN